MTQKLPCPHCGEMNYAGSITCWACGKPLKSTPPPEPMPELPQVPLAEEPMLAVSAELPIPTEALADPTPIIEAGAAESAGSPQRVAAAEAAALRDKEYVTPPVEVEAKPSGPGEWGAYLAQAISGWLAGFKQSLDEYDRQRGRKSGNFSSFGCLITAAAVLVVIALVIYGVSLFAGRR